MSTLVVGNLQSDDLLPPVIKNSDGTEIGTFCRAWVNFNGTGTVAIRASFNVSSITDNGTGNYTVNLTTALADANFAAVVNGATSGGDAASTSVVAAVSKTTNSVTIDSESGNATPAQNDLDQVDVAIFR